MIFIWLTPLFIAVNIFYIIEISKWLKAIDRAIEKNRPKRLVHHFIKGTNIIFIILWTIASLSIYIGFLLPTVSKESFPLLYFFKRFFKLIGNYHLGVFIYMGMSLLVILLCRLIEAVICKIFKRKLNKKSERFNVRRSILGVLYVAFIIAITMHGVSKAKDIKTNRYELSINKSVENFNNLKIVMVADLHLGYNIGCSQMEKMVNLINAEEPDIILIAGDIFDNEYVALDDPAHLSLILSSLKSKYGTYAVYGNHDIDERIIGGFTFNWKDTSKGSSDEMDNFLSESHIKLLCDQYELIDDSFYIYGRPDYERPGKAVKNRKAPSLITKNLDMTKPVIVIDHEPRELLELSQAGVDLDLCGHTHDGQFFPMNLTSRYLTWENSWGILKKGNMTNIVTSGVGLFGPNIRVGTQAEICSIEIHFE